MAANFHNEVGVVGNHPTIVYFGFNGYPFTVFLFNMCLVAVVEAPVLSTVSGGVRCCVLMIMLRIMLGTLFFVEFFTGSRARCVGIELTTLLMDHVLHKIFAWFAVCNALVR